MRALRILVAGLVALAAMLAVFLAAAVVVVTGAAAWVLQLFRPVQRASTPAAPAAQRPPARSEAIDVVATRVPFDPPGG